jgi:hypothetical protein
LNQSTRTDSDGRLNSNLGANHGEQKTQRDDQSYFLIGEVIRRITGQRLSEFFAARVAGPG